MPGFFIVERNSYQIQKQFSKKAGNQEYMERQPCLGHDINETNKVTNSIMLD